MFKGLNETIHKELKFSMTDVSPKGEYRKKIYIFFNGTSRIKKYNHTHTKKNITRGTQQKILAAEQRIGTLKYRSIETTQSEDGKKE